MIRRIVVFLALFLIIFFVWRAFDRPGTDRFVDKVRTIQLWNTSSSDQNTQEWSLEVDDITSPSDTTTWDVLSWDIADNQEILSWDTTSDQNTSLESTDNTSQDVDGSQDSSNSGSSSETTIDLSTLPDTDKDNSSSSSQKPTSKPSTTTPRVPFEQAQTSKLSEQELQEARALLQLFH